MIALNFRSALQRVRCGAFVLLLLTASCCVVRAQSALDGFDPNANGVIRVVVVQPDGKIILGGDFTSLAPSGSAAVTRNRIARLNPDGTLDPGFDPNANNTVNAIAVQADGQVLVGGSFTSIGGQSRNRIARLDRTTGLPDSFDPNSNNTVFALAVQGDGKILAGGFFANIGGQSRNRLARLDPATGLADSFDPNANGPEVFVINVQPNGMILLGGFFTSIGGQIRNNIARLDPNTGLADSFNPNASDEVHCLAVQPDGKVLAGGFFTQIGGLPRNSIARLDSITGAADSFNPNPSGGVFAVALQADGKILAGGEFFNIGGQSRHLIARLDPITGLADSFDPSANSSVNAIAVQGDGKILAGGGFTTVAPNGGAAVTRNRIARFEIDGRADQTLNLNITGSFNRVLAIALQPDGKTVIGGVFSSISGVARPGIARLNTDGTLDTVFNANANSTVTSIALQPDGKIVAGGYFFGANSIGGQFRNHIARLDPVTGLADSFDPNANDWVFGVAVQPDGKILVGGFFSTIGGQARTQVARLDGTTGLADSFNPNSNGTGFCFVTQADGQLLIGGDFTSIGGQARNRIARLDPNTGLADSFNPNANDSVRSIVVDSDGKILVSGYFTSIGGQPRNHFARLDPVTGLADSFNPSANGYTLGVALQSDRKIIIGSSFGGGNQICRVPYDIRSVGRFDPITGLSDSFNGRGDGGVDSLAIAADGKVLVGGLFNNMGGQAHKAFTRLTNDIPAFQYLSASPNAIYWIRSGSSPKFARTTFEYSTDNVNYIPLGDGTAGDNNWVLSGLDLPLGQNIYVRARGFDRGSIIESVRNAFLTATTGTPTPTPTGTPTPTPVVTPTPTPSPTPNGTPSPTPACWTTITHSTSQAIAAGNSVSCNNGTGHSDTSYWRAFRMADFASGTEYNVSSVEFGIDSVNQTQSVTARLYAQTVAPFPGGSRTLLGATTTSVTPAQSGTVVATPLVVTVPAGTIELVMELFTPSGQSAGNLFFIGSNTSPETGPSYLSAAGCGLSTPTTFAALGFPGVHIVLNVNGTCTGISPPTPTPTPCASCTPTPGCGTFSNPAAITIPATDYYGPASPYPSNIVVSGLGGAITKVTVAINSVNYTSPDDVDVLLVGPEGQYAFIMSDVGGSTAVTGVNLVFDDSAPNPLPDNGPLVSGTFRPTNIDEQPCSFGGSLIDPFPSPAPWVATTNSALSAFNGTNPNGTWSLYVVDDYYYYGVGSFPTGWSITISTDNCTGPSPTPLPTPTPGTTHFAVVAPGGVYQGETFQFTVTALDRFNNIVTNYPGTIHFTSSDPYGASLPPNSGLSNGTGTFNAYVLAFMYTVTIIATDTGNSSINGISNCIGVGKHQPPTPSPTPVVSISGNISYCSNPTPGPVPSVTLTLTGSASRSTLSDGTGNYNFSFLGVGGSYTVTPTKAALGPGTVGINTVDEIGVQRHFLAIGLLSGCRLTAADVNGDATVNTVDVIAIQRFFLGYTTGLANVGKYQFSPVSRSYSNLFGNQTNQNYDTLIFGDVAPPFVSP